MVETVNNFPVLFAEDMALTQPRALLTVTDANAEYHAVSKEELADQWQDILEQALRQALALRRYFSPEQPQRGMIVKQLSLLQL